MDFILNKKPVGVHATLEEALADLNGPFLHQQFKLYPRSNEEAVSILFNTISQRENQPLQLIATPGIDINGNAYIYIGMRIDRQEVDYKLPVNDAILEVVLQYMNGADELPAVDNIQPEKVEDDQKENWIKKLEEKVNAFQAVKKETVELTDKANYVKVSYRLQRGKLTFNKGRVNNIIDLLR